jgi:hypothetical protein
MAYDILISYPALMGTSPTGTTVVSTMDVVQTLNAGANTVVHGIGYLAKDVTVKDSTGAYAGAVAWQNIDVNTIEITVGAQILNAVISIEVTAP